MKLMLEARLRCHIKRENDPQGGYRYKADCPFLGVTCKGDKKEEAKRNLELSVDSLVGEYYEVLDGEYDEVLDGDSGPLLIIDRLALVSGDNTLDLPVVASSEDPQLSDNEYWLEKSVNFVPATE